MSSAWAQDLGPVDLLHGLPEPDNVSAVAVPPNIALSWQWKSLPSSPAIRKLEYEVQRGTHTISVTKTPRWVDKNLLPGTWTYRVRVRVNFTDEPKTKWRESQWSESVSAAITSECELTPRVSHQAVAKMTRELGGRTPRVLVNIQGSIQLGKSCTLQQAEVFFVYPSGQTRSEKLTLDADGNFDQTIEALDAYQEPNAETVDVFIVATSEAGRTQTDTTVVDVRKRNKFAPSNSNY